MPELHWLEGSEAKRAVRRVPYRLLDPVETLGAGSAGNMNAFTESVSLRLRRSRIHRSTSSPTAP